MLFDCGEGAAVLKFRSKCQMARISPPIIAEMETAITGQERTKRGIKASLPKVAAKWLNKMSVPSGYADEIVLVTCLGMYVKNYVAVMKRLDELIEATNVKPDKPAKPAEKKEGAA